MVWLVAPSSAQSLLATPAGSPLAFSVLLMSPEGTQVRLWLKGNLYPTVLSPDTPPTKPQK